MYARIVLVSVKIWILKWRAPVSLPYQMALTINNTSHDHSQKTMGYSARK